MTREEALNDFLSKHGWGEARRFPLPSDASGRTYERLKRGRNTAIVMNSPLDEKPDRFVLIDDILRVAGVHAPAILGQDLKNGFLLLEDFGEDTFTKLLAHGVDEYSLYRVGVDTLIRIQNCVKIPAGKIEPYTPQKMLNEVMMMPNWYGKYALPNGLSENAVSDFRSIWSNLVALLDGLPQTLVLQDYHVDNLMITLKGDCGVLDFQDARTGPVIYDLMSLLEDERRDVSASVRARLLDDYFKARPEADTPAVRQALPVMAMQRHTRVVGIFMRLFQRDKKDKYLGMIPFVWTLIERHLDEPVFAPYRDWVNRYIPVEIRHKVFRAEDFK